MPDFGLILQGNFASTKQLLNLDTNKINIFKAKYGFDPKNKSKRPKNLEKYEFLEIIFKIPHPKKLQHISPPFYWSLKASCIGRLSGTFLISYHLF